MSTTTLLINDGFNILAEAKTSDDDGSNATSPPEIYKHKTFHQSGDWFFKLCNSLIYSDFRLYVFNFKYSFYSIGDLECCETIRFNQQQLLLLVIKLSLNSHTT